MLEKLHDILTKENIESILNTEVQIAQVNDKAHGFAYAFNNLKVMHGYEYDGSEIMCVFGPVPRGSKESAYFYRKIIDNKFINDDKEFKVIKAYNIIYPILKIDDIVLDILMEKYHGD